MKNINIDVSKRYKRIGKGERCIMKKENYIFANFKRNLAKDVMLGRRALQTAGGGN